MLIAHWFSKISSTPKSAISFNLPQLNRIIELLESSEANFFKQDKYIRDIMLSWNQIYVYRYALMGSIRIVFGKLLHEILMHFDPNGTIQKQNPEAKKKNKIKDVEIIEELYNGGKILENDKELLDSIRIKLNLAVHYDPYNPQGIPISSEKVKVCFDSLLEGFGFYLRLKNVIPPVELNAGTSPGEKRKKEKDIKEKPGNRKDIFYGIIIAILIIALLWVLLSK